MSGNSTYLGNKILNWLNGTVPMGSSPSALYIALWNGDPTDSGGGGAEVTTTIRPAGRVTATFGSASAKSMTNTGTVNFGAAAGSATADFFAVFDALSSGNMLGSGTISGGGVIGVGVNVSYAPGALTWGE